MSVLSFENIVARRLLQFGCAFGTYCFRSSPNVEGSLGFTVEESSSLR